MLSKISTAFLRQRLVAVSLMLVLGRCGSQNDQFIQRKTEKKTNEVPSVVSVLR